MKNMKSMKIKYYIFFFFMSFMSFMVKNILHLKKPPKYFDTSDALAVALCHNNRITNPRSKFVNWKTYIESHPEKVLVR